VSSVATVVRRVDAAIATRLAIAAALLVPVGIWSATHVVSDVGDGVNHHLAAHLAFAHPQMLLDAWCKPLFTLLAAPLASLGFAGTVLFQSVTTLGTATLLWAIGMRAGWRAPWLAPLLLYVAPGTWQALLSGWTEPLFGLLLVAALWSLERERWTRAYLLIGFLPFVRAEGWVLMLWWALLAIALGRLALVLPLALGHVVYAIAGTLFIHHDPLWMFRQNPYWVADRPYGNGTWTHFVDGFPAVAGLPAAVLVAAAIASVLLRRVRGLTSRSDRGEDEAARWCDFVAGSFLVYFVTHVVLWRFGLFKSFGLLRVLIAVLPVAALVATRELERLCAALPAIAARLAPWAIAVVLVGFALGDRPTSLTRAGLLRPTDQQRAVDAAVAVLRTSHATPAETPLVYSANPYVPFALDLDVFDRRRSRMIAEIAGDPPAPGAIVVWDSWFSVAEHGVSADRLAALTLEERRSFVVRSPDGGWYEVVTGRVPVTALPAAP
jgi:hypothetical protein